MLPGGALNLRELQDLARERLTPLAYDYYASGAHDERTLRENVSAWERIAIHYRVLVDVSKRDASTTVLGTRVSMPVLVAPTAFHGLACGDAELATARAAGRSGTVMILSSLSNTRVEEVCSAASGPVWFQLYVYKDRGATAALVGRAEAAGARALVLTVDAPLLGRRERDVRNRFHLPEGLRVENMSAAGHGDVEMQGSDSGLAAYVAAKLDPSLSWKDVAWLRSVTKLPLLVKGLVRPDDAVAAIDAGASGIVVSNHGGRQLDGSPATASVPSRTQSKSASRSSWTAGSAAGRTSCAQWRWAPAGSSWGAPSSGGWPWPERKERTASSRRSAESSITRWRWPAARACAT
jgi:4-hydroxymandelate oxidase